MEPFVTLESVAAPLPEAGIDTDVIFPARFLLLLDRAGLGRHLFHERRHARPPGSPPFVLDRPPHDRARILVTGPDFGIGSSREQAVWALADFGIRCIIAPSFGEIFHANCFRNGLLPVTLPPADHARILAEAEAARPLVVDLPAQTIRLAGGERIGFAIEPHRRQALLEGLDEIALLLREDADAIAAFEARQRAERPWLFPTREQLSPFDDLTETPADG